MSPGPMRAPARMLSASTYRPPMSDSTQSEPVMAGSDDASNEEKLAGLIEQVDQDHGAEGAGAMADHLRDRMEETKVEPEDLGDLAD
jgi:hypothetical protein